MPDVSKLNPQIAEVEIGVRDLRKLTIYPLSLADQLKMTEKINKVLSDFFESGTESLAEFTAMLVNFISNNLPDLLKMVIPADEKVKEIVKDLTNLQLSEIVRIVYEVNYKTPLEKNLKGLPGILKILSTSERPSQQSANGTDTDLNTSSSEVSSKEELPSDNSQNSIDTPVTEKSSD